MHVSVGFVLIPSSRTARLYGNLIFSFFRNLHTLLHNGCTSSHSQQQYEGFLFSTFLPTYPICVFLMTVILTGVHSNVHSNII